jgi:hypothetical protein
MACFAIILHNPGKPLQAVDGRIFLVSATQELHEFELATEIQFLRIFLGHPDWCYALLRIRPLPISCAEGFAVISCGKVDYDKSGYLSEYLSEYLSLCQSA